MLVQFKSDVGGLTMFVDVATRLLRMTGHSGTVPSAIPAEDMAQAVKRLRDALDHVAPEDSEDDAGDNSGTAGGDNDPPVPLRRRAFPLLDLMDRAVAEGCGMHWDKE